MKKIFLLILVPVVLFLSACSFELETKKKGDNVTQENSTQKEEKTTANNDNEMIPTNLTYIEDLQPGYNYGVEGISVKSAEILFFPEGTINEWKLDLILNGELSANGEYYVSMAGNNPYCFKLDDPNLLPLISSKRVDVVAKYGRVLNTNSDFCFRDEQSDYLANNTFGEKFIGDQINTGRATIKIKDISIHEKTTAESYNSAVLLEAIKN